MSTVNSFEGIAREVVTLPSPLAALEFFLRCSTSRFCGDPSQEKEFYAQRKKREAEYKAGTAISEAQKVGTAWLHLVVHGCLMYGHMGCGGL